MARVPGIWWLSEHWATGYGEAGRRAVRALVEAGVPVRWVPLDWHETWVRAPVEGPTRWSDLEPLRDADVRPDVVVAHCVPEALPRLASLAPGVPLVSHVAWETTGLPKTWPALLNRVAAVWVPCPWNADVVASAGVHRPIGVIPHVLRAVPADAVRREATRRRLGVGPDDVCVLNIAVWGVRKAPWLTARVVADTYTRHDPVVAVIKSSKRLFGGVPGADERDPAMHVPAVSLARQLAGRRDVARVVLVAEDDLSEAEIDDLLRAADVYLTLSHGEGVGLGGVDAAASGIPVIATGWGGQRDYLDGVGLLVDADEVPVTSDHDSYDPSQRWAEPDLAHAGRLLRTVVDDPAGARARAEAGAGRLRERYSAETVAAIILDEVQRVLRSASQ